MKQGKVIHVEISHRTVIFTVLFLLLCWFLYQVRSVILGLFVAFILVGILNPTVERLERWHIPRWLAAALLYLLVILLFVVVVAGLVPPLIDQISELTRSLPFLDKSYNVLGVNVSQVAKDRLRQIIASLSADLIKLTLGIFTNLINIFGILVISFYLLLEHRNLDRYLFNFFGQKGVVRGQRIVIRLEKRLGGWIRAELLLMFIVGAMSYFGFLLLGLKFALALGILAGFLEIIPNVGPVLAAVPAILFGLAISPLTAGVVAAWCFLVQQLENNFIVPRVMNTVTGVNPVITLLVLAIGVKLAGVLGMLIAVPSYLIFEVLVKEWAQPDSK